MCKAKLISAFILALIALSAVCALAQPSNPTPTSKEFEELRREVSELKDKQSSQTKDTWDKLGTISTLISGLLVTVIGLYATQKYSERQREKEERLRHREIKIQQVEIVEKFFPHLLSKDEMTKSAALQAIATIGNEDLALRLSKIFDNTHQDETQIQTDTLPTPASPVADADRAFSLLKRSIVLITSWDGAVGIGYFCTPWGLILALGDVVRNMPKALINIKSADKPTADGQVWLIDTQRGIALMSSRYEDDSVPLWGESTYPSPGTEVFTMGHNSAEETFIPLSGRVSKYQVLEPSRICIDIDFLRVLGGAPVLTKKGQFIGMISEYNYETKQALLIPASVVDGAFIEQRKDIKPWQKRQDEEYMRSGQS